MGGAAAVDQRACFEVEANLHSRDDLEGMVLKLVVCGLDEVAEPRQSILGRPEVGIFLIVRGTAVEMFLSWPQCSALTRYSHNSQVHKTGGKC